MRPAALALAAALVLAGCGGPPPRPAPPAVAVPATAPGVPAADAGAPPLGVRAAALAASLVGVPYRYGGATPAGFDCSGLVFYVYQSLGVTVPRTAVGQRNAIAHVDEERLQPGDLVFFYTPSDHVGIYLGGGEFVHAPASGRSVARARLDTPYFALGYAGGGRLPVP
jgi:cell wall-associated NlpC family hydrolase